MCGGTEGGNPEGDSTRGLSPRVRGNPAQDCRRLALSRSIPACAGEPARRRMSRWGLTVYPRVCGGTQPGLVAVAALEGLSPRVRGNPVVLVAVMAVLRSIPACAGEPGAGRRWGVLAQVYPRVCGGTTWPCRLAYLCGGLSPRVRGNLLLLCQPESPPGSIPACAGEPNGWPGRRCRPTVYPRVCGGTLPELHMALPPDGLSPRVRGNHI